MKDKLKWQFMMYDRDGSGSITTEEMKAMFVMMCQEPEHLDLEPMELKLVIKGIERMAEEMFHELDADGDGFVTQVSGLKQNNTNLLSAVRSPKILLLYITHLQAET